jgi:hypothetical protein
MPSKKKLTSIGARSYSPRKAGSVKPRFAGRVVKLHDVARSGLTHEVKTPTEMGRVKLMATNPTGAPLGIDPTGSFLAPSNDGFQRLLVAGAIGAIDGIVVVAPGQTVTLELVTACMDQCKSPPDGKVQYELSTKPAPDRFQSVARAFAELASEGKSRREQPSDAGSAQSQEIRRLVGASVSGDFQGATWNAAGN